MNRRYESHERNQFQRDNRDPQIADRPTRPIHNYVPSQSQNQQPQRGRGPGADVYYGRGEHHYGEPRGSTGASGEQPVRAYENDIDEQFDNARSHSSGYDDRGSHSWSAQQSRESGYRDAPTDRDTNERSGRGGYTMNYGADHRANAAGQPEYFGEQNYPGAQRQDFRGKGPKNYARSDERIKEDINEKLTDAPWLDASDISVQVRDGKVLLEGSVSDRRLKYRVEDVIERCHGVKDIENRLTVNNGRKSSHDEVSAMNDTVSSQTSKKH